MNKVHLICNYKKEFRLFIILLHYFYCVVAGVPLVMMLVWVISRVMLAREELGQDQGQHAEIEMVAMLDVRQFQSPQST